MKKIFNAQVISNIFSLGALQIVNYILPLITIPYLVRVLGPEYFGLTAFATSTVTCFILFTDYGFNFSATKEISINRMDNRKVGEIFSAVLILKFLLMLFCFLVLTIMVLAVSRFRQNWQIFYLSFGIVIGQIFTPTWFFQGLEKMKYITYINVLCKLLFTIPIFLFIKVEQDYLLLPIFNSLGFLLAGLISIFYVFKDFEIKFQFQKLSILEKYFKSGWYTFLSNASLSIYSVSTTFFLGILTNNTTVGLFAASDKIVHAFKGLFMPVLQGFYPFVNLRFHENKFNGIRLIWKLALIFGLIMLMISFFILLFAPSITHIVLGDAYFKSIIIIQLMAFSPLLIAVSNTFSILGLFCMGKEKIVSSYVGVLMLIHIVISISLIRQFEVYGAVASIILTELLIAFFSVYYFKKQNYN